MVLLLTLLLSACPSQEAPPEALELVSAAFDCRDEVSGPLWTFSATVSGRPDEDAARAYAGAEGVAEAGFALTVIGGDSDQILDFHTEAPGTPEGAEPAPGEVPLACSDLDAALVRFCASDFGAASTLCWACGDGSLGAPPEGNQAWFACQVGP